MAAGAALLMVALTGFTAVAQEARRYQSATQGFGFNYPSAWREVPGDIQHTGGTALERVLLQAPDGILAFVSVAQLARRVQPDEIPGLQAELDSVMLRMAAQAQGEILAARLVTGEVAGKEYAFYYQINFPRDNAIVESRQYILFAGERQFIVALEAEGDGHSRHEGVLDLMFSSLEIQEP